MQSKKDFIIRAYKTVHGTDKRGDCLSEANSIARSRRGKIETSDGYRSEHKLRGYLHVGKDYSVFLRIPKPHDKFLIYELYEARNANDLAYKPMLLAVSKIPVSYIREQLKTFREELYKAKYVDDNIIPGTEVQTLREWQINRAINFHSPDGIVLNDRPFVLRTVI